MNFLIDSAKLDEIAEAMALGFVHGVTTNTREMAWNATEDFPAYLQQMRTVAQGTIHVQVTTVDATSMIAEGLAIHGLIDGVRVKIPVTAEGVRAIQTLTAQGVEVAATAVNTVTMAVLAATAGARSVIPYYGVLEDFEADATDLLADIMDAFDTYGLDSELVYFARNVKEVRAGIRAGATGCLMTLDGLKSLFDDPFSKREVVFMNSCWHERFGERTWASG
jgi:transaldolase